MSSSMGIVNPDEDYQGGTTVQKRNEKVKVQGSDHRAKRKAIKGQGAHVFCSS